MKTLRSVAIALALTTSAFTTTLNNRLSTPTTSTNVTQSYKGYSEGSWVGRLSIYGYSANLYQSSSQSVVDAYDSAALIDWGGQYFIADHAAQGFSVIRGLGAGATATITDDNTITYLTMASSYQGYNTGEGIDLVDGRYAEDVYDGNYILYTCNDETGYSVTVTYWYESGSEPVYVEPAPVYEEPVAETPTYEETTTYEEPVVETTYEELSNDSSEDIASVTAEENEVVEVEETTSQETTTEETVESNNTYSLYNMINWSKQDANPSTESNESDTVNFFFVDFKKLLVVKFFNF